MSRKHPKQFPHPNILQRLHGYWFFFLLGLGFIILFPWFFITLSFKKLYPLAHYGRKVWGWALMWGSGLFLSVKFEGKYNRKKTYIIAANHTSYVDIPVITCGLPGYFNFLAKAELERIPVFGRFFRTIDIGVDRKNVHHAGNAFKKVNQQLKSGGPSIAIFPEGTIGPWVPELGKFKDGPFKAAIDAGVDILPITLADDWIKVPEFGPVCARPGRLRMYVHRPVSVAHLKPQDAEELKQKVFAIIENKLKEYEGNG